MKDIVIGRREKHMTLLILFVVSILNYIDRTIISILQVPIKNELGLSDAQLGSLTGIAFAAIYSTISLPLARVADRCDRRKMIAIVIIVWSVMTIFCGLATSFATLLLFRIGVAIGEAGSLPATHSLLSDFFGARERATAIALWNVSVPAGLMLGLAVGGWLAFEVGWRNAYFLVGALGFVIAPLVYFGIREPQRGRLDAPRATQDVPPLREAIRTLWQLKSFRYMLLGAALHGYMLYTVMSWSAPFYARVHHLELTDIAIALALLNGLGGGIGIYLGGFLAERWGRRDPAGYLLIPMIGSLGLIPFAIAQYWVESTTWSFALAVLPSLLTFFYSGPIIAVGQSLVSPSMRAFTSATIVLVVTIFGMGLGPTCTGIISDWLIDHHGLRDTSLRYAIGFSFLLLFPAGFLFWRASRHLRREFPSM